jgi:hypothetical protein
VGKAAEVAFTADSTTRTSYQSLLRLAANLSRHDYVPVMARTDSLVDDDVAAPGPVNWKRAFRAGL